MRYTYNKNAFATIQTEAEAYWLGFLLADGYVSDSNCAKPFIQIKLAQKDKDHLVKFAQFLNYNSLDVIKNITGGAYTRDNPCCVIKISCRQMSQNLDKYGLHGAKSGAEIPYILNNVELEKHYIRGIIDGDGWIRETQTGWGVCGSYETLQYIKNYIQNNITDISDININPHGNIFKLEMKSLEKTKKILTYFYKDATIYLNRKFNLYNQYYSQKI